MSRADQESRNVVVAAAALRGFNQICTRLLQRFLIHCFGYLLDFDVARQAVAAQQQHVLGIKFVIRLVWFDAIVSAERPHDDVLHFRLFCLFQRHQPAPDLLHHQRMVVGELHYFVIAD